MAIGAAIHFLSCLPQFCLHSEEGYVVDMRTGALVSCLDEGDEEVNTHLLITWPGVPREKGLHIGAVKYLELQTSEAVILNTHRGDFEFELQAALTAINENR